jgi:hypothetical protein
MKRHIPLLLSIIALVLAALSFAGQVIAGAGRQISSQEGAPTVISYQGQVTVNGSAYNGRGYFKFAVITRDGLSTSWSNDGTSTAGSEPTASVPLTVTNGSFAVLLGDTTMIQINHAVFSDPETWLRVWFGTDPNTFQLLSPDRQIAAVPYALQAEIAKQADMVGGYLSSQLSTVGHKHAGQDIYSGTVSAAYIDTAIARTSQITPQVWANDGTGSRLDADLLDGQHGIYYLNQITPTVWTNAGPGSGLDADLLDGQHARALQPLVETASYTHRWPMPQTCGAFPVTPGNFEVISLTVPGAGTIIVEANTTLTIADSIKVTLALSRSPDSCPDLPSTMHWDTGLSSYNYSMEQTLSVRRSYNVTQGGTYTFYLNGMADINPFIGLNTWESVEVVARYYPPAP